ncbi:MAG: amidohydrolase family protein, partial [Actinomycetota bacterium]|nr:amidohydrolase family protein [Actinomycetota bacterium]
FGDLRLPGGQQLTARTFERYRAQNRLAVAAAIPEDDVRRALAHPLVMIGSDSIIEPGAENHPRGAGTFARVLGRYVREEGVLSLMEALAKMTWYPVARLERAAPALRRKGRLQIGADADVTVFDPSTVADRATVEDPARPSTGVEWVLVAGRVVKSPAGVDRRELPGQAVRREA